MQFAKDGYQLSASGFQLIRVYDGVFRVVDLWEGLTHRKISRIATEYVIAVAEITQSTQRNGAAGLVKNADYTELVPPFVGIFD